MASTKSKGLTDGVTSEWTLISKVKPGQEQALREHIEAGLKHARESAWREGLIIPVGTVHDYRWTLFDKGTRLVFTSNFDGDWSTYIDDFFATKVVGDIFDEILSFCEGYPGASAPVSAKKEYMLAHTEAAWTYARAYKGTVKEMWKAVKVQKAFQQVLDDPGAVKALTATPALKPLLDVAGT